MIIYVMLTALSFLEFVPYQLLLKSYISFLQVRFKSINVAKLVKGTKSATKNIFRKKFFSF